MNPDDENYGVVMSVDGPVAICTWCMSRLVLDRCPVCEPEDPR